MTYFATGATVAEEGDVYWWEAWEDVAVEKKRKRAESFDSDAEDAVWQAGLHEMSVEVCACCLGHFGAAVPFA